LLIIFLSLIFQLERGNPLGYVFVNKPINAYADPLIATCPSIEPVLVAFPPNSAKMFAFFSDVNIAIVELLFL